MNKIMLNSLALLTLTCGSLLAAPYAQFSTSSPDTYADQGVVIFNEVVHRHKIDLCQGTDISFDSLGVYQVDFSAVGLPVNGGPSGGFWGLQLQLNGKDVGGASVIQVNNTGERLEVSRSVLVKIKDKCDTLRLIVEARDPSPIYADLSANITISRVAEHE